jgi:hypothetical protein
MISLLTFIIFLLPLTLLASPLTPPEINCTISQAPAYGGVYTVILQPTFTPAFTENMTREVQESEARKVAEDLHINSKGTQFIFFDSITMIAAHMSWERACEISSDMRVCILCLRCAFDCARVLMTET